jgi:hypothetical protein
MLDAGGDLDCAVAADVGLYWHMNAIVLEQTIAFQLWPNERIPA